MLLCCVKTIKDVFIAFAAGLADVYDKPEVEALTLIAIGEVTGLSKAHIKAFPETTIKEPVGKKLNDTLAQLITGKPLQYILGYTEFFGLRFLVNPSVLIPRPETEELVQWCIESSQSQGNNILDIGTGSGCIAISLKKNLPDASVTAIDISAEALNTAKENAALNQADINFIEADALKLNDAQPVGTKFTLIVSNPPYVTLQDKTLMHTNVTDFEPHTALFVPEDDPLLFYREIALFAAGHLVNNGLLFFEINESYGYQTVQLLSGIGFMNIELRKDMSGKFRMIKSVWCSFT